MGLTRRRWAPRAVTFDLDDTLFPQAAWLAGAWDAVVAAAPADLDRRRLRDALDRIAAAGTDAGRIVDRALAAVGRPDVVVGPLVDAFREHRPDRLDPYPGVVDALDRLRARVPIALVSDGDVRVQTAKLGALGLTRSFDAVIWSDRYGRIARKPSWVPFAAALAALGVPAARTVHVGDRPAKDVVGARAAGLVAIRVRSGEYASAPDVVGTAAEAADAVDAVAVIEWWIDGGAR